MAETTAACAADYRIIRKQQAEQLLEEKYHEEFTVARYDGQQVFDDYYTVTAYSEAYPDLLFQAGIEVNGEGFSDTYATRRVEQKISEKIAMNLNGIHGYVYIYSEMILRETVNASAGISIDDYMKLSPGNRAVVHLFLCPEGENAEGLYTAFQSLFKGLECLSGTFRFYIMDEERIRDVQEYIESNPKTYQDYTELTEDALLMSARYEAGRLQLSRQDFLQKVGGSL